MLYVLYVVCQGDGRRSTVHLVNETGEQAHSAPSMGLALRWLWQQGEQEVVAITDDGPELFLIEPCGHPALCLPSLSMRRSHLGGCCDLPDLPGLAAGAGAGAQVLQDRDETTVERRRRHAHWVRRSTSPQAPAPADAGARRLPSPKFRLSYRSVPWAAR